MCDNARLFTDAFVANTAAMTDSSSMLVGLLIVLLDHQKTAVAHQPAKQVLRQRVFLLHVPARSANRQWCEQHGEHGDSHAPTISPALSDCAEVLLRLR